MKKVIHPQYSSTTSITGSHHDPSNRMRSPDYTITSQPQRQNIQYNKTQSVTSQRTQYSSHSVMKFQHRPTTIIPQNIQTPRSVHSIPSSSHPIFRQQTQLSTNDKISPFLGSQLPQQRQKPQLQNIVSTANLCCKLDLRKIAMKSRNAEYNPKRFAAVIMRIRQPKTTALIFQSGKIVCTGAKSEQQSKTAAMKYAKIVKCVGFQVKFKQFKVQNIVASCAVPFAIRLQILAKVHHKFANYQPEIFPGLIYRMYNPKVVLLIFVSGKVVLTGAKTRDEIQIAFDNIVPVLQEHKKQK